ncbi:hypothetical protein VTI74DRAFT_10093 [Chaetomium olivicolor]
MGRWYLAFRVTGAEATAVLGTEGETEEWVSAWALLWKDEQLERKLRESLPPEEGDVDPDWLGPDPKSRSPQG